MDSPKPTLDAAVFLPLIFFASGSAGLVYEVVWTHQFANILGSTSESMAMVFAIFLAGLAVGSHLFGKREKIHADPLLGYAWIEIGIGLLGALSCYALVHFELSIIRWMPDPQNLGLRRLANLLLVTFAIGPATILMGGSLPVVMSAVQRWAMPSQQVSWLYGLNTFGAALGALLPGFVLVPRLGLSRSALVAASINVLVGCLALLLRRLESGRGVKTSQAGPKGSASPRVDGSEGGGLEERHFLFLSFFSGFSVLSIELAWGRLARFVLGNRSLAISSLLASVLLFLGLASLLAKPIFAWLKEHRAKSLPEEAELLLKASGLLQILFGALAVHLACAPPPLVPEAFFLFGILLGVPFFAAGLLFPWLLTRFPQMDRTPGESVGRLYTANVFGSVAGSLGTSFLLLPKLGTPGTLVLQAALALLVGAWICRLRSGPFARSIVGELLVLGLSAWALMPGQILHRLSDSRLLVYHEDRYGIQALEQAQNGEILATCNNVRLVARLGSANTSYSQHLQGDIPMLVAPNPKRVLNVGTGFGITAGAIGLWDSVLETQKTIEILPFMVQHQKDFARFNYNLVENPRIELLEGDGRYLLTAYEDTYDVISVNPLDPTLPGSTSLCTIDFWKQARSRLNPGGIYAQLFWGEPTKILLEGIRKVFPSIRTFRCYRGSWTVVASPDPEFAFPRHLDRIGAATRRAYQRFGVQDLEKFFQALFEVAEADTEEWIERIEADPAKVLHSQDRPILEYFVPKGGSAFRTFDELGL